MKQFILDYYGQFIFLSIICNLAVFILYGIDKRKAVRRSWRISETALLVSSIFGVIGAICGMLVFSHKTRKAKFYLTVPVILIAEMALVYLIIHD